MRKVRLYEERMEDELGRERQFHYYLLVEDIDFPGFFSENYGVSVEEVGADEAEVWGITPKIERIEALLRLLSRQKVSPTILEDVVADWL